MQSGHTWKYPHPLYFVPEQDSNDKIELLLLPSAEQKAVIHAVSTEKKNVQLNAVAGSGKTTTVISLVQYDPQIKILLLTYNVQLKIDTRQRVVTERLKDRLEVHSFHAMGVRYYSGYCKDDTGLDKSCST
jgi:hypothetical protein